MRTKESLQRRYEAVALHEAADFGFAPDCWVDVQNFIEIGVQQIVNEGALDDDIKIALAQANLARVIVGMMIEARNLGLNQLHETTLVIVKGKLCPLFPFC